MNNAPRTPHYREPTPLYVPEATPALKVAVILLRAISVITILCSLWIFISGLDWEAHDFYMQNCPYDGHIYCPSDPGVGISTLGILAVHALVVYIMYTGSYLESHIPSWSREYHMRSIKGKVVILPIMWAIIFLVSWVKKHLLFRGCFYFSKNFCKKIKKSYNF